MNNDLWNFVWELMQLFVRRDVLTEDTPVQGYCDACGKSHARGWFTEKKTGDSFFLCKATGQTVIEHQSDKTQHTGRYTKMAIIDLINRLL